MVRILVALILAQLTSSWQALAQEIDGIEASQEDKFRADAASVVSMDDADARLARAAAETSRIMNEKKQQQLELKKKKKKAHKAKASQNLTHTVNISHTVNVSSKVKWNGTVIAAALKARADAKAIAKTAAGAADAPVMKESFSFEAMAAEGDDLAYFQRVQAARNEAAAVVAEKHRSGADARCLDSPRTWSDSAGDYCFVYEFAQLCAPTKTYGANWSFVKGGQFSDYAAGTPSVSAIQACCACGGGTIPFSVPVVILPTLAPTAPPVNAYNPSNDARDWSLAEGEKSNDTMAPANIVDNVVIEFS